MAPARALLSLGMALATLPPSPGVAVLAQQPPALATSLQAEVTKRGALTWDAAHPLAWAQFLGPAPSKPGLEGAGTTSGILYGMQCDRRHLDLGVLAIFEPGASWVKPVVVNDSVLAVRLLAHEQGHFDISELSARRLRLELEQFAVPCDAADTALGTVAAAATVRERALQARYDSETVHGTQRNEQLRWESFIDSTLDSLRSAALPWITRKY
jgi:hypothetical protein